LSLRDVLTKDLIRLQIPVENWQEAVQAAGNLMEQAGLCTSSYVDAMVQAVEQLGPYMVLAPGIALAHARPEDGMLKAGMSIVTLSTPVNFGSAANDPVGLVIGFGGVDKTAHVEMLRDLAIFLSNEDNQQMLKLATDVEAVLAAFE
jgi:mannitol/fructose-specific phosphotransferase system IIA component (Ntr-type)